MKWVGDYGSQKKKKIIHSKWGEDCCHLERIMVIENYNKLN